MCKHTIHATDSVPAKIIVTFLTGPLRYEGNIASVMLLSRQHCIRIYAPEFEQQEAVLNSSVNGVELMFKEILDRLDGDKTEKKPRLRLVKYKD